MGAELEVVHEKGYFKDKSGEPGYIIKKAVLRDIFTCSSNTHRLLGT